MRVFSFRPAEKNDFSAVLSLYRSAVGTPFCTWNDLYPGPTEIESDTETGNLLLAELDGVLTGAVSIVPENELDDRDVWEERENAREIARVVLRSDLRGRGLSASLVSHALEELRARGVRAVHLSAAAGNIPARRLYLSLGFRVRGEADLWGGHYYLMEKAL